MTEEPAHDPHSAAEHPLVALKRARGQRTIEVEARTRRLVGQAAFATAEADYDKTHPSRPPVDEAADLLAEYGYVPWCDDCELADEANDAIEMFYRARDLLRNLQDARQSPEIVDAIEKVAASRDRALWELERVLRANAHHAADVRQRSSDRRKLICPSDLRPPAEWSERTASRITPERFLETNRIPVLDIGAAVAAAIEAKSLLLSQRVTPPKVIVGQVVAFFTMHGLPPPQEVVEALATAMSLNRRVPDPSFADVAEAIEAARLATADAPVPRRKRAVVLQVVRWFADRGEVLPGDVFHTVIIALGLSGGRGALRQKVKEQIAPTPKPEPLVVGLRVDGRGYRLDEELPKIDDENVDAEFVVRERPAVPRMGLRKPDLIEAAVESEARQRLDFATEEDEDGELEWGPDEDPTKQETPHRMLARTLSASPNTIRALVESTAYQMAVYSRVFWRSKLSRQWRWRRDDR